VAPCESLNTIVDVAAHRRSVTIGAGRSLALVPLLALELLREQSAALVVALGECLRRDRSQRRDAVSLDELAFAICGGVGRSG
jgi:hypothetical protein